MVVEGLLHHSGGTKLLLSRDRVYLPEGRLYYLVVWDRFGDGFCCGETGNGYYNLYWGTEVDPS
jgi:hypothetical protein